MLRPRPKEVSHDDSHDEAIETEAKPDVGFQQQLSGALGRRFAFALTAVQFGAVGGPLRKNDKYDKIDLMTLTLEAIMVPRIDIDDVVFRHLQANAVAYVETPNDTLRRLLGLDPVTPSPSSTQVRTGLKKLDRRPKASLGKLIRAGYLKNGQKLQLRDYKGNPIAGETAIIGGDGLFADEQRRRLWSMSDLAAKLLKKHGYKSESVRGPSHWVTENGRTVTELWEDLMVQTAKAL